MSENQNQELDTTELIGLVEGTVKELKNYVREKDLSDSQIEQIINAEKSSKDRKTARNFLEKRLGDKESDSSTEEVVQPEDESIDQQDIGDTSLSREALLKMLGGTVEDVKDYVKENNPGDDELQSLLHAEKIVKDRKTVVRFLKSYSKKRELEEDFHEAETDLNKLKNDLQDIEENVLEDDVELDLESIPDPEKSEDKEETGEEPTENEETEEDDSSEEKEEEEEQDEPQDDEETEEESNKEGDEEDAEDENDEEETEEELTEFEKKKEVLKDLELDLSDEEVEQISLEELEKLRAEKEKRNNLIDKLSVKFDRAQLEKVTTKDLEKLADEVADSLETSKDDIQKQEAEAKRKKEKAEEEMKKEAQEDLEMMMGAVKNSTADEEDSGPSTMDQIKQFPDKVKGIFNRGGDEEEESTGFDTSKTIEVLDGYTEYEDREAAVKTAQVMKGYLEYALGIEREMTYAELADEMESEELGNEHIDTLIEFYRSMKISVYTGNVEAENIDEVIEASKAAVKELN